MSTLLHQPCVADGSRRMGFFFFFFTGPHKSVFVDFGGSLSCSTFHPHLFPGLWLCFFFPFFFYRDAPRLRGMHLLGLADIAMYFLRIWGFGL